MKATFNANRPMTYASNLQGQSYDIADLAQEEGVFSCSLPVVMHEGTPLIKQMVSACFVRLPVEPVDGWHYVVDARVQRLMPGMYPAIPGWHGDNVPRHSYTAQPDVEAMNPKVRHATMTISTHPEGVSRTEFVREEFQVDFDEDVELPIWQRVHRLVENADLDRAHVDDGVVCVFGMDTIHRATPAAHRGWRAWVRVAMHPSPAMDERGHKNAEQVYILSEENGW